MSGSLVCVVDASVAIKLFLAEPLSSEAHALFACLATSSSTFHVPDLLYAECGNILWKHVQRGNGTAARLLRISRPWRSYRYSGRQLPILGSMRERWR